MSLAPVRSKPRIESGCEDCRAGEIANRMMKPRDVIRRGYALVWEQMRERARKERNRLLMNHD